MRKSYSRSEHFAHIFTAFLLPDCPPSLSYLTVPHLSYLTVLHLSPTWLSSISLLPDCSPSLSYLTVLHLSPTWLSSCCSACGPPSPVVWGMFSHSEDRTFSAPGWVRSRLVTAAQRNGVEKVRNRALHYKHYD